MTVKVVGWELARICAAFSHLFVNLINTRVRHPVDYKHRFSTSFNMSQS